MTETLHRAAGGLLHTVHNARVQLIATMLNNIALAFIVAGFVAPTVAGRLSGSPGVIVTVAWVATGLVIHLAAYLSLGRPRQ